jgi:hypothetical protein
MKTSLGEPERRSATIDKLDHDSHSVTVRFGSTAACGGAADFSAWQPVKLVRPAGSGQKLTFTVPSAKLTIPLVNCVTP